MGWKKLLLGQPEVETKNALAVEMDDSLNCPPGADDAVNAASGVEETCCSELTADVLLTVFKQLDVRSLVHSGGVCRQWRELAGADALWEGLWKVR